MQGSPCPIVDSSEHIFCLSVLKVEGFAIAVLDEGFRVSTEGTMFSLFSGEHVPHLSEHTRF